jgi:hypothetical protein
MRSVITQTYGAEGVLDKLAGCKGPHPNRAAPEIEQPILDTAYSTRRMARCGCRRSWRCHDRLLRLKREQKDRRLELRDEQVRLLERFSPDSGSARSRCIAPESWSPSSARSRA